MNIASLSELVVQLGPRAAPGSAPDADLLGRFLADRDDEAFALLVRRHGPLVFGVCRRVTGDQHLAEDAFQAVFVVLAAKAGTVRPPAALPAWLYGVAYRTALRARTMRDRRRRHENPVATVPEPTSGAAPGAEDTDMLAALDEEIARLPESQRVPVVVCELEGASRQEAAARLGISEGTLSSRLARARKVLADRLRRRGVALSAAGLTAALARLAPAGVPNRLVSTAVACATGPGLVPAGVAALSHGVLRLMFLQKLTTLAVAAGLLASAIVAYRLAAAAPVPKVTESTPGRTGPPSNPPAVAKSLPPGPNKLLVLRDGRLVLIDPDGKIDKQITADGETFDRDAQLSFDCDAQLSPDGKMLAVLVRSGEVGAQKQRLYVRGLDQKGPGTDLGVECKRFTWSPDGSEIACAEFPEGRDDKAPGITHFVVDVRTKGKKPLKVPEGQVLDDWSLDGKVLLTTRFGADKDKPQARLARLYLVNRDGSENKALTDEKQFSVAGRLSPDGKRVLHAVRTWPAEGKGGSRVEMTVLDISTGKSVLVGDVPKNGEIAGARWSPDGKRIAYVWRQLHGGKTEDVADKETEWRLVVCDPDGRNAKTILTETGPNPFARPLGLVDWR